MIEEPDSSEDRRGGGRDEVSPWFEVNESSCGEVEPHMLGSVSLDDDYRDVVPDVEYLTAWRDARAAEAEYLAALDALLKAEGAWVRSERLITRLGVGVLRMDMPSSVWRECAALMRDGLRYRARGCGAAGPAR
jgi:hypothetical protein